MQVICRFFKPSLSTRDARELKHLNTRERTEYERGLGGATQRMADISSVGGLVRVLYRLLEEIV